MSKLHLLIALLLSPILLIAQTYTGNIVEDATGEPIPFAKLQPKGSDKVFYADLDGCYSFDFEEKEIILQVSYPGFDFASLAAQSGQHQTIKLTINLLPTDTGRWSTSRGLPIGDDSLLEEAPVIFEDHMSVEPMSYSASDMVRSTVPTSMASGTPPPPPPPPPAPAMMSYDVAVSTRAKKVKVASSASPEPTEYVLDEVRVMSEESDWSRGDDVEVATPAAGQLTAGEVNDFGKWDLWNDVSQEDLAAYRSVWGIFPDNRYSVQLTLQNGLPATNVQVELVADGATVIWSARTDNHGRAELWRHLFGEKENVQSRMGLQVKAGGKTYALPTAHSIQDGINALVLPFSCLDNLAVDIAFVVDATGSMSDEINYLNSELQDVMRRAADSLQGQDLRLGSVFYRDHTDGYLTRHIDFNAGLDSVINFVGQQRADGGGDTPEAVDDALAMAMSRLKWRDDAVTRLLFLVLDAPPHSTPEHTKRMKAIARRAAAKGIRIIPVVCSGMDQSGEYLLRSLALATNGTYTFLTDHSGIGGRHLEPSTDSYTVEKLNDLLVRVIHQFGKVSRCTDADPATFPTKIIATPEVSNWSVYPNPTVGPATMQFEKTGGIVFLIDVNGKVLRRFVIANEQQTIQLSDLPSGTYFLRHEVEGEVSTKRIMVSRA